MTRMSYKDRNKKRAEARLIIVALVVLLVVAAFGTMKLRSKSAQYAAQEQELLAQIEKEQKRSEEITEMGKYMETKKYVEEVAKERLGLVYEDEILFKAKE